MGTGEFNAGGNLAMDWYPIQGGVEILLVTSCGRNYRNRHKLRPDLMGHLAVTQTLAYLVVLFVSRQIHLAPFLDKHWHHVCITWNNDGEGLKCYVDGSLKRETAFKSGVVIQGGGVLVLGQDQDSIGGGFEIQQSLAGLVSHMNMWNFVLRTFALVDMATGFGTEAGNVVSWRDIVRSQAYGQVEAVPIAYDPPKREYSKYLKCIPLK